LIAGFHPMTGDGLPSDTPYPVSGTPGDGVPDGFRWMIEVKFPRNLDLVDVRDLENTRIKITVFPVETGGDPLYRDGRMVGEQITNDPDWDSAPVFGRSLLAKGGFDLPFDAIENMLLGYKAQLFRGGDTLASFFTQVTVGNPELTIHSTIVSDNLIGEGDKVTGTVNGKTALALADDFRTLSGRGPLHYESFEIEHTARQCTISKKTKDGSWGAVEIVLPDSLPRPNSSTDGEMSMPPPGDAIIRVDPGINESAVIMCPPSPPFPLPFILHFFAGFYSFHGGEFGHANEMDEDRGGLVMPGWEAGSGNVIATKTYDRAHQRTEQGRFVTFSERTILNLQWPEGE